MSPAKRTTFSACFLVWMISPCTFHRPRLCESRIDIDSVGMRGNYLNVIRYGYRTASRLRIIVSLGLIDGIIKDSDVVTVSCCSCQATLLLSEPTHFPPDSATDLSDNSSAVQYRLCEPFPPPELEPDTESRGHLPLAARLRRRAFVIGLASTRRSQIEREDEIRG
jgi:hypothetical protein